MHKFKILNMKVWRIKIFGHNIIWLGRKFEKYQKHFVIGVMRFIYLVYRPNLGRKNPNKPIQFCPITRLHYLKR